MAKKDGAKLSQTMPKDPKPTSQPLRRSIRKRKANDDTTDNSAFKPHKSSAAETRPNTKKLKTRSPTHQATNPKPSSKHNQNAQDDAKIKQFTIPFDTEQIICQRQGTQHIPPSLIFTHGAGGGITAPAIADFADGFAETAPITIYQGTVNLASRIKAFAAVTSHESFSTALGGRSMGARAACLSATAQTKSLILVSFPLVGDKKKDSRAHIIREISEDKQVLFIVGDRDKMCGLEHLRGVIGEAKAQCWVAVVEGADHGMSWKWKESVAAMRMRTGALAAEWLEARESGKRECRVWWDEEAGEVRCSGWA